MVAAGIAFDRTGNYNIPFICTAARIPISQPAIIYSFSTADDKEGTKSNQLYLLEMSEEENTTVQEVTE